MALMNAQSLQADIASKASACQVRYSDRVGTNAHLDANTAQVSAVLLKHVLLQHLHGRLGMASIRITDCAGEGSDVLHDEADFGRQSV